MGLIICQYCYHGNVMTTGEGSSSTGPCQGDVTILSVHGGIHGSCTVCSKLYCNHSDGDDGIFCKITLEAMKADNNDVALQGIEFWSTVCDEEQDLAIEAAEVNIM